MATLETGDRAAFLRAVADAPDDDTPRLVFADWLSDHGEEEYGEFIRVQVELARLDPYHLSCTSSKCGLKACNELRARQSALLTARGREWSRPIADALGVAPVNWWVEPGGDVWFGDRAPDRPYNSGRAWRFARGFVAEVRVPTLVEVVGARDCPRCAGSGTTDNRVTVRCQRCSGSGRVRACPGCGGAGFDQSPCKVCGNTPDEYGTIEHGRGCRVVDEDGGGSEVADDCSTCSGSGTLPVLAPRLAGLPVERVWVADRVPVLTNGACYWGRGSAHPDAEIPECVWEAGLVGRHPSPDLASAALAGAIAWFVATLRG